MRTKQYTTIKMRSFRLNIGPIGVVFLWVGGLKHFLFLIAYYTPLLMKMWIYQLFWLFPHFFFLHNIVITSYQFKKEKEEEQREWRKENSMQLDVIIYTCWQTTINDQVKYILNYIVGFVSCFYFHNHHSPVDYPMALIRWNHSIIFLGISYIPNYSN